MDFLCMVVPSWQWTPLWCVHCMRMGDHDEEQRSQDGVALRAAKRKKVATYPELVGLHSRAKLVVLGVEVGGRWSDETRTFLSRLAKARARTEMPLDEASCRTSLETAVGSHVGVCGSQGSGFLVVRPA